MQKELDALLAALAAEQEREVRLIRELVGILGQASSARQRMVESLAIAVAEAMGGPVSKAGAARSMTVEQVSEALEAFRAGKAGFRAH
jgi:hypothetical protein